MAKKCPRCTRPMNICRDEYTAYCEVCHIAVEMPRAAYNDIKAEAVDFNGDENAFAETWMESAQDIARRAYRAAKKVQGERE